VLEYLRAFLSGRVGWDALGATLIISGAFGMFRRSAVVAAGGYATDTVGEDMELVVRLHRHGREMGRAHQVAFVPDPVAWTECPETVRVLARQRDRWQRGLMETIWRHRVMLFNPKYGRVGTLAFPYFFFLEMCGPVIEGMGYVGFLVTVVTGRASGAFILAFLALAFAFGMALSIAAVALEELTFRRYPRARDMLQLFWLAVAENLGYRQLSTYWRIRGVVSKLRGASGWGAMERRGFKPRAAPG
jgi:cellulose synthase/poly-beta-1,6-N-acetylglucosamine synthase-like glycosyltransferase